jgi:hypothetical protein
MSSNDNNESNHEELPSSGVSDKKIKALELELERIKGQELDTPKERVINQARIKELEQKIAERDEYLDTQARKREVEQIIRNANEMIHYHKSEIVRLEMIKNGGFPVNYLEIPNLTHYTYQMLHSFALFLADHKIALESCGVDELGIIFKYFRKETLEITIKSKEKEVLKDVKNKSKLSYGEKPTI